MTCRYARAAMRTRAAAVPALVLVCLLAACGQPSSASKFKGDEADVAKVVESLQTDGERAKADDICSKVLARALQDRIAVTGSTCGAEMKKAIEDADRFELEVQSVTVNGATASAR